MLQRSTPVGVFVTPLLEWPTLQMTKERDAIFNLWLFGCDVEVGDGWKFCGWAVLGKSCWSKWEGRRGYVGRISEPRLGMGERVFYYIVGLVTHSRNWQREGATRGRSSSTLGELCDPLSPQLCAIVLIGALLCELCALVAIRGTLQPLWSTALSEIVVIRGLLSTLCTMQLCEREKSTSCTVCNYFGTVYTLQPLWEQSGKQQITECTQKSVCIGVGHNLSGFINCICVYLQLWFCTQVLVQDSIHGFSVQWKFSIHRENIRMIVTWSGMGTSCSCFCWGLQCNILFMVIFHTWGKGMIVR